MVASLKRRPDSLAARFPLRVAPGRRSPESPATPQRDVSRRAGTEGPDIRAL